MVRKLRKYDEKKIKQSMLDVKDFTHGMERIM